jgi:hypothetical protein
LASALYIICLFLNFIPENVKDYSFMIGMEIDVKNYRMGEPKPILDPG